VRKMKIKCDIDGKEIRKGGENFFQMVRMESWDKISILKETSYTLCMECITELSPQLLYQEEKNNLTTCGKCHEELGQEFYSLFHSIRVKGGWGIKKIVISLCPACFRKLTKQF
jgi:hypothetical protein